MSQQVKKSRKKVGAGTVIIYVVLSLWALTTIYPFVWVGLNSFKTRPEILANTFSIPTGDAFTFDNYIKAWTRVPLGSSYVNSIIITAVVTLTVILLAGFCAYGLARYNFKGKAACQALVVASMMFPVFSTIIPVFRMMSAWGLLEFNSWWLTKFCVILPQIAGNLSFAIIVLQGFIKGLPLELEESAYLEGCNIFQIFFKIIIPIAKPSFATVAIFTFLWSYNDMFTQMFFLRVRSTYTITRLLNEVTSIAGTDYGMLSAAVVIVVAPVLLVYILLQKNIIKGLTVGAVKG